jgi:cell wall-associated NlpC family hydrolase
VKPRLRFLVVMALAVAMSIAPGYGQEQKETLGDKLKKLFARPTPTPTPTPRRSHRRSSPSPTASATEPSASSTTPSSEDGATIPTYGETPLPRAEPSASIETLAPVQAKTPETQYFEPVRPISPGPRGRIPPSTIYALPQSLPSPSETPSPIPEISEESNPEERPTPSLPSVAGSTLSPIAEHPASQASVPSEADIIESKIYPEDIRKLIELSLDLAKKNLNYKYASADPANGGLDCSGFIYYVLTKSGVKNVPRDAREQYVWVRKAGNFQAVLAHADDTFELDALKPGDFLFWVNNSGVSHEAEITQTMIYIGRDKSTNQRLMVGASEGGVYKGEKRSGVSVFDFKLGANEQNPDEEPTSVFVGYGSFPDLSGN